MNIPRYKMITLTIVVSAVIFEIFVIKYKNDHRIKTCLDYKTSTEATKWIWKYPNLDGNRNGVACEGLPK